VQELSHSKKTARSLVGAALMAFGLCLLAQPEPARALPAIAWGGSHPSTIDYVRDYRRRRGDPPVYPYYYGPGRPGGWSAYFGFVPYARGNYEIQALQRRYPETNWPPSLRYYPYR
jgi:hypothetical protein